MFTRKPKEKDNLDVAIDLLISRMDIANPDETARLVDQVTKLVKCKETLDPKRISPDTILLVAGNLVGILLILNYEKAGVITTRALNFVMKLR